MYSRHCGEQMEREELDIILAYRKLPEKLMNKGGHHRVTDTSVPEGTGVVVGLIPKIK